MKSPTWAVFDFGGVVFRWRPAALVQRVWPHRAGSPEQTADTVAQLFQAYQGDWGRFDQGLLDEAGLIAAVCARTGWPEQEMHALLDAVPQELIPQPAVVALIERLKARGVRLSYLSNMPAPLARRLEREYPLQHWFEKGVFSSSVRMCKPAPALFQQALTGMAATADECLLIDDHPLNVQSALACGWQAELFTAAQTLESGLKARGLL